MFNDTTLLGLDKALEDLHRAIDGLPDDAVKQRLRKRYQRLQRARETFGKQPSSSNYFMQFLVVLLGTIVLVLALYLLLKKNPA